MHRLFCIIVIVLASFLSCKAQDILFWRAGDSIAVVVVEVHKEDIKYKRFDNVNGPIYTTAKSDVAKIRYANGVEDLFPLDNSSRDEGYFNIPDPKSTEIASSMKPAERGRMDARLHYKGYRPAGTATLITSLVSPVLGLIPAIACSASVPREKNLDIMKPELMKNPDYRQGYTREAHKIKVRKVWMNLGIGLGVNVLAVVILAS
jgi:hypothetical protein